MMRYTEKRNGKNVIPLRNAVCGVELPHWSIDKQSDVQSFLSGDAVDRLAEYEDDEESGKIVRLPCKVGNTVFTVEEDNIEEHEVLGVLIQDEFFLKLFRKRDFVCRFYGSRSVYLTREEAEKRLKELR